MQAVRGAIVGEHKAEEAEGERAMNARQDFVIQEDCKRIIACLSVKGATTRAVTAVVKRLLLNAPYFYNGVHIDPKAKTVGAGVWEIRNGDEKPCQQKEGEL